MMKLVYDQGVYVYSYTTVYTIFYYKKLGQPQPSKLLIFARFLALKVA